jgi:hypothetical protein
MMSRTIVLWNLAVAIAIVATGNGFAAHHGISVSIEDFQRAKVEIGKMVERGEVTKEHAETRLIEMRRMIRGERKAEEHQSAGSRGLSIEDFQRAKVAIGKRVESGHITKEHAETRLIEMRRMIGNGKSEGDAP